MLSALVAAAGFAFATVAASNAQTGLPVVVVRAPQADLHLEVARTETERERGLMDRTGLAPHAGMIFVFEQDGPVEFWMKDTLVPLDMIFVAPDGTVRNVYARVATVSAKLPDASVPREAGVAKYVIELAAGEAARDGIAPGIRLAVPDLHA
ncbi:MAG: DUF192 domain-containing protein [Candidatus Tumulicola sp.]